MKTLMLTLFSLVALVSTSWGQIDSPVKEETKANSKGSFNALTMELPGTTSKGVQKAWGKFIKKLKGKTKFDRKTNEYIADDATIKDMSDNTVDIIMKIEERGQDGTAISVWFNLGASYLSSKDYAERYPAGEKILKQFANLVSADMIEEELKEAEKQLKELEDLLKKLEKDEAQRIKDIETYRATIQKMEESIITAEGDIKKSEEDQGNTTLTIEEQKKIVEDIQKRLDSVK
jgi:DNA repair exonuclease SbcCD ATPase subunit